jgi:ubiquinone/menaquinone biosynthesis C-methylase UbiE
MIMTPAKGITPAKNILNSAHNAIVFGRRVRILASIFAREIPAGAHVLDVGTGDGSIAAALVQQSETDRQTPIAAG